jgi:hypothetical protein
MTTIIEQPEIKWLRRPQSQSPNKLSKTDSRYQPHKKRISIFFCKQQMKSFIKTQTFFYKLNIIDKNNFYYIGKKEPKLELY